MHGAPQDCPRSYREMATEEHCSLPPPPDHYPQSSTQQPIQPTVLGCYKCRVQNNLINKMKIALNHHLWYLRAITDHTTHHTWTRLRIAQCFETLKREHEHLGRPPKPDDIDALLRVAKSAEPSDVMAFGGSAAGPSGRAPTAPSEVSSDESLSPKTASDYMESSEPDTN